MRPIIPTIFFAFLFMNSWSQSIYDISHPPEWSKNVTWYQIFVERFFNGDKTNDPTPFTANSPAVNMLMPEDWSITPWTQNWYKKEPWQSTLGLNFNASMQYRRFGGDLQGVLDKMDYLQSLGITALFINPVNDAPSLHKYDARNYHHIDVNFGPDPAGDIKLIASENPEDPTTWQWTTADKMFLQLINEAHRRNMKIIMDYSWNHVGTTFWAWQDVLKNQEKSPYKNWFEIKSFDDASTPQNEFTYSGWANVNSLPEIKKVNITTPRVSGFPYEGDLEKDIKHHIFDVTKRWLAPNGDTTKGIDGFRLDVADQVGMVFWRDFRKYVRSIKRDTYLVGEIWWIEYPDRLMDPSPYTSGDVFDAVMFYQVYRPARYFFAKTDYEIDARQLKDSLEFQWNRLRAETRYAMMNVSSSHDAPRLLTDFYNTNKYKYRASPHDDPLYKTGIPDDETYSRLKLYLVHLFTTMGAPDIWNGEEMGMTGAFDPDNRKPLWWKDSIFENERVNNFQPGKDTFEKVGFNQKQFDLYKNLIKIRNDNQVLRTGSFEFLFTEGKRLAYKRKDASGEIIVMFNVQNKPGEFHFNYKGKYTDLLTGRELCGRNFILPSFSAMVLKRK